MTNITNSSISYGQQWTEPFSLRVVRLVVFSLIILASLFGNSLIVKTVMTLARTRRPFTYTLVMNLAMAEIVNTFMLPFLICYDEMVTWVFGQLPCQLISPLQNVASSVITSTVAAIAGCRCCFVMFPQQAHRFQRHRYAVGLSVVLWLLSLALSMPSFLFNRKVESLYFKGAFWCITILPGDSLSTFPAASFKAFVLVQIVYNFLVSGTIMILSYCIVIYKIHNSNLYVNNNVSCSEQNETEVVDNIELPAQNGDVETQPQQQEQQQQRNKPSKREDDKEATAVQSMDNDLFRMFYAIVLIFILCYYPYQIVFIMEYFNVVSRQWQYLPVVRKYLLVLTCLPSALHPLCYGLMTKFYSKAFSKIILCQ